MRTTCFTAQQIAILKQNLYTAEVTTQRIQYTLEFKLFVIKEAKAGLTSVKIFEKAGYNPDMIGITRIYTTVKNIKKEAASSEGLQPPSCTKQSEKFAMRDLSKKRTDTAVKELQDRIVYLEQEIDFLKKTSLLAKEYHKDR